jgi:putative salt-induced outer membrane protein YdiY
MPQRLALLALTFALIPGSALAQPPAPAAPKEPTPLWDTQVGASFVDTSGNSDTTTFGADFSLHRHWPVWTIESSANAVRTTASDVKTAERYLGMIRGQRKLTSILSLSAGERAERDRFAGIDFRSILDAGLGWALVRQPAWTLDGVTAIAWNHESPIFGPTRDDPVGLLQLSSRTPFSATADSTQRFTFYPDFRESGAYRAEAELAVQAALNSRLALKVGYVWRYSNAPVLGFEKNDQLTTASVVLRWKSDQPAPM